MSIGRRIKQAREKVGISQTRLAKLLGVTRSACSQWESDSGTSPRRERLEEIAQILKVNYEWLATGKGPMYFRPTTTREAAGTPGRGLQLDQQELLDNYQRLDPVSQEALLNFLRTLR
ncbi:MAG: helix-turn-helix transcriptional regulator [Pseudomonadota bacterium]|nr:helix-turn-helix transcriptional regulator [Pseudomonadota bacterium]